MKRRRVCLIVDNPLRDLEGLTLVAWELAQRNCEAWLVPMYEQALDVRAVDADFVLANYARFNNRSHLCSYMRDEIRVGVLDTEGVGGKNADEFATLVGSDIGAGLVDLYCAWGPKQGAALVTRQIVNSDVMCVTGCPRYDYCVPPWRDALPRPELRKGYVLINTNFPTVNPRFSSGSSEEILTMISAGFEPAFAQAYVRDARAAQAGMVAVLDDIVDRFPSINFVLRPHPFESDVPYQALATRPNFQVRQEGTSIEWLNGCQLLIHLNCSTAVEAAMLGKTAISLDWLDTPTLNVEGPHRVSLHAVSPDDLVSQLAACINSSKPAPMLRESIEPLYHHLDGRAAQRVAEAVLECLQKPVHSKVLPKLPLRFRYSLAARCLVGYRVTRAVRRFWGLEGEGLRNQAKLFTRDQVNLILRRIQACAPGALHVVADSMGDVRVAEPRLASGTSICITASIT